MEAATPYPPAETTATEKAPMDALVIHGGRRLSGRVTVSGAKNAALPVMAATLLMPGVHKLRNVPDLRDVETMAGYRAALIETAGIVNAALVSSILSAEFDGTRIVFGMYDLATRHVRVPLLASENGIALMHAPLGKEGFRKFISDVVSSDQIQRLLQG